MLRNGPTIRTDALNIRQSDEHSSEVGDGIEQIDVYRCLFGGARHHAGEASDSSIAL